MVMMSWPSPSYMRPVWGAAVMRFTSSGCQVGHVQYKEARCSSGYAQKEQHQQRRPQGMPPHRQAGLIAAGVPNCRAACFRCRESRFACLRLTLGLRCTSSRCVCFFACRASFCRAFSARRAARRSLAVTVHWGWAASGLLLRRGSSPAPVPRLALPKAPEFFRLVRRFFLPPGRADALPQTAAPFFRRGELFLLQPVIFPAPPRPVWLSASSFSRRIPPFANHSKISADTLRFLSRLIRWKRGQ